jgi:hypothetical protein
VSAKAATAADARPLASIKKMKKAITYITIIFLTSINYVYSQEKPCAIVGVKDGISKLISFDGKVISKSNFLDISIYKEGYWSARKTIDNDTLAGFIDKKGVEHCFDFKNTYDFNEGYAVVQLKTGEYNFVDSTFNKISSIDFDFALEFREGFAPIRQNGEWAFLKPDGELLFKPKYDDIFWFINGFASVKKNNKYGYIDTMGEEICEIKFTNWREFKEDGLAFVSEENKGWNVIDTTGKAIFNVENLLLADPYFNEFGTVKISKKIDESTFKFGYINKKGEIIIPVEYDRLESFHNYPFTGAGIKSEKGYFSYSLIDISGKIIRKNEFSHIHYYYEGGVSMVTANHTNSKPVDKTIKIEDSEIEYMEVRGKMGVIDTTGKILIPMKYHRLSPEYSIHRDDYFDGQCLFSAQLERDGLSGILSDNGKIIVPFKYNFYHTRYLGNGLFYVENENKDKLIYDSKSQKELNSNLQFDKLIRKTCIENMIVLEDKKNGRKGLKTNDLEDWTIKAEYDELVLSNKHNNLFNLK